MSQQPAKNQINDEKLESTQEKQIPAISQPTVSPNPDNTSSTVSEVRCPHLLTNKHTGKIFRCNYKAMELDFGKGSTKCRNCRKIFSFEVNTTYIQFLDKSLAQPDIDVLE